MTFYWWNDAVNSARRWATLTHVRHRVFRTAGGWTVELAETAVLTEVCS